MKLVRILSVIFASALLASFGVVSGAREQDEQPVNILLVTVDDMNWNSVGAFGNSIADITPNIDRLANEGRRYERAYVVAANCSPSRVALQTGLYPQQSGATGFFYIDDRATPSIAGELRRHGYLTGVINKLEDTNASPDAGKYWDYTGKFAGTDKYAAQKYSDKSADFFGQAKRAGKPFYLVVNIADPHKPNFNDGAATKSGADVHEPSRIISEAEATVPGFLPPLAQIRRDVRNYYNSVKRADDVLGEVMMALRESGQDKNTLVIFLSDHGMPFPFAKSSVYDNGLRTPLIMRWGDRIAPGGVETGLVSTIDLMPTILDAAGVPLPNGPSYLGTSLFDHPSAGGAEFAFGSFDENARGYPVPMRGVISRDWSYAFNAWADGELAIKVDDMNHASFKAMERGAAKDPAVKVRLDAFTARPVEELCYLKIDPDCLINLAGDPAYADVLAEMQQAMRAQMVKTDDYLLPAFDVRGDQEKLRAFMRDQHKQAQERASRLRWKRGDNIAGRTKANTQLFRRSDRR